MPAIARKRRAKAFPVLNQLEAPGIEASHIAALITENPGSVLEVLQGLSSNVARVRFGCAKVLRVLSERAPQLLYPHFKSLVQMLGSDHAFLRWDGTRIIGNLAAVDHQEQIEKILDRLMEPITDFEMIGAATSIQSAVRIAQAKPHLADSLARHILKVEFGIYKTPECRNVAIGHAIVALDQIFREMSESRQDAVEFILRQRTNSRAATRRKADTFFEKGML